MFARRDASGFGGLAAFGRSFLAGDRAGLGIRIIGFDEAGLVLLEHRRHHVDALRLHVGFLGRTSDVNLDRHRHFRVQRDADLVDEPEEAKQKLRFVPVETVEEVLSHALDQHVQRVPADAKPDAEGPEPPTG